MMDPLWETAAFDLVFFLPSKLSRVNSNCLFVWLRDLVITTRCSLDNISHVILQAATVD